MKNLLRLLSLLLSVLFLAPSCLAEEGTDLPADIQEAIRQETAEVEIADSIPSKYLSMCPNGGSIVEITFPSYDYFGDGSPLDRHAFVYLPAGYSEDKQYNLLVLCHGIGGNEYEWGMTNDSSRVKKMMDNLTLYGDIEPFIIVTPNGKAGYTTDYNAFYLFGKTLRNDLLPYMDANFATYGHGVEDLTASREHRAMAGLSMGGMQTINIGMCECLDLFSWFGAFSAAPTSYPAAQVAAKLNTFPEEYQINYMYNICGDRDEVALASASAAAQNLPAVSDRITESNWCWQQRSGAHDFSIWYLGFYNFARIFGGATPVAE